MDLANVWGHGFKQFTAQSLSTSTSRVIAIRATLSKTRTIVHFMSPYTAGQKLVLGVGHKDKRKPSQDCNITSLRFISKHKLSYIVVSAIINMWPGRTPKLLHSYYMTELLLGSRRDPQVHK